MPKVMVIVNGLEEEQEIVFGATGQVLYNNNGAITGAVRVAIGGGDLLLTANNTPTIPSLATAVAFTIQQRAGRSAPSWTDSTGVTRATQVSSVSNSIFTYTVPQSGLAPVADNCAFTAVGLTSPAIAYNASIPCKAKPRGVLTTTATAGSIVYAFMSGVRFLYQPAADPLQPGGFTTVFRWCSEDTTNVPTKRIFIGMSTSVVAPTNVEPSTLLQSFGIIKRGADTNYQFYSAATAPGVVVDLGANFPCYTSSTVVVEYELVLHHDRGNPAINYEVKNLTSGATVTGTVNSADRPTANGLFGTRLWISNNAAASACSLTLLNHYGDNPR